MRNNRNGEKGKIPERHERFFQTEDYWYYTTREGVDIGPFDSLEDACHGANEFIDFICGAEPAFSRTLAQYKPRAVA